MQPYSNTIQTRSESPLTLRSPTHKKSGFEALLSSLQNDMARAHPSTQITVGQATIRSQLAAMSSLLDGNTIAQMKNKLYPFLTANGFSNEVAHLLVYGTELPSRVARVMDACKAGINAVSDRVVEPPLRFVLKRVVYDTYVAVRVGVSVLHSKLVSEAPQPPAQQAQTVQRAVIINEPVADREAPPSRCSRIGRAVLSGCTTCWNKVPQGARKWLTKTLVDEFIKDPIKEIARKATAGTVLYVSGAAAYAAGGAIVAAAGAVSAAVTNGISTLTNSTKT